MHTLSKNLQRSPSGIEVTSRGRMWMMGSCREMKGNIGKLLFFFENEKTYQGNDRFKNSEALQGPLNALGPFRALY